MKPQVQMEMFLLLTSAINHKLEIKISGNINTDSDCNLHITATYTIISYYRMKIL